MDSNSFGESLGGALKVTAGLVFIAGVFVGLLITLIV